MSEESEPKTQDVIEIEYTINVKVVHDLNNDSITVFDKDTMELLYYNSNNSNSLSSEVVQKLLNIGKK